MSESKLKKIFNSLKYLFLHFSEINCYHCYNAVIIAIVIDTFFIDESVQ